MLACCLRSVTISGLPKVARMVGYSMRRGLREPPSPDQRKFLETLRDLGPRNSAETLAVRRSTKRACQVRGWVEWRCLEDPSDVKAWHLTIAGQKALKFSATLYHSTPTRSPNASRPVLFIQVKQQ